MPSSCEMCCSTVDTRSARAAGLALRLVTCLSLAFAHRVLLSRIELSESPSTFPGQVQYEMRPLLHRMSIDSCGVY